MRIIILGAPGSGKGTQAKLLANNFSLAHISTGDLLRQIIQSNGPLAAKIQSHIQKGEYVPEEMIVKIAKDAMPTNNFILDGFPRTLNQAKALFEFAHIDYVLQLDINQENIVNRISNRRIHEPSGRVYHLIHKPPKVSGKDDETGEPIIQRADDTATVITKRLKVYEETMEPVKAYLAKQVANYIHIDANQGIDAISHDIAKSLA